MSDAFMARVSSQRLSRHHLCYPALMLPLLPSLQFKNKIATVDRDGGLSGDGRPPPQAKSGCPQRARGGNHPKQPRRRVADDERYDWQEDDRSSDDYQHQVRVPAVGVEDAVSPRAPAEYALSTQQPASVGTGRPGLNDLDSMMLRESMQSSKMPSQPPMQPPRRQQPSSPQHSVASSANKEMVRQRSPLRAQKQQANTRGQKKPATKTAARSQYQDDPINQYYRNRPKQKPSRARATYLDEKLEAEEKERSDPSTKRNQAKIQTYSDHLAYSKKARPVNYRPKNLKQWKENKPEGYQELGKLQPDLNADHLVEQRANRDRVKEFSRNLHRINEKMCKDDARKPRKELQENKELSSREKAQAYAKRVPRPRRRRVEEPVPQYDEQSNLSDSELGAEAELSALDELEMKHNAARKEVEAIRKQMAVRGL